MHEALAIGIPTFVVLLGILWNGHAIARLKDRMGRRFDEVRSELQQIKDRMGRRFGEVRSELQQMHTGLRQFFHELGRHEGEIEALKGWK